MADYAIGDIQGCYEPLLRLLDKIAFSELSDTLWFVGDLVNRGPHSLEVLRFIKQLPRPPRITLGNHDLHFLNQLFGNKQFKNSDDTLKNLMKATDREELGHWLRQQPFLIHDEKLNIVLCHAGIAPQWHLEEAKSYAQELHEHLKGNNFLYFLDNIYGNEPNFWSDDLQGPERMRVLTSFFTRMRFCNAVGALLFDFKGPPEEAPPGYYPWFQVPHRRSIKENIVFGHWAALQGKCPLPNLYAIDTGCLWGHCLTALNLESKERTYVTCKYSTKND